MTERLFVHSLLMLYSVHVCVCACKLWEWCIVLLPAKHSGPWSRGRAWWDIKIVAHTRLPSVGFRSWARFLVVSLQVTWVINAAVVCHYFPPGQQLPSQPWDNRWDIDHQITRVIGSWVTEVWCNHFSCNFFSNRPSYRRLSVLQPKATYRIIVVNGHHNYHLYRQTMMSAQMAAIFCSEKSNI